MCMYLCVIWLCSDAYQYESYGQPGAEAAGYGGYGKYLLLTVSIPYLHKHVLNGLVMCALVAEEIIIILTVVLKSGYCRDVRALYINQHCTADVLQ